MLTMIFHIWLVLLSVTVARCQDHDDLALDLEAAEHLASLPFECYQQEWPHKYGLLFHSESELRPPSAIFPIFGGCLDWHSAVHGHWLLARAANQFPNSSLADKVEEMFDKQFTTENVQQELKVFQDENNKSFERTYGWAWLLKLQEELLKGKMNKSEEYADILSPLVDEIVDKYIKFLPTLAYPVRAGTHRNTAFGLIYPLEYDDLVKSQGDKKTNLTAAVLSRSRSLYGGDEGCPLTWEPSGYDFLSPCLQEADLMRLIVEGDAESYGQWLQKFLPSLLSQDFKLEPGQVLEGSDYLLVHIEGVNFSRAWNLYNILMALPESMAGHRKRLFALADAHVRASRDQVVGSHYAGSHWLGSFYMYALDRREEALKRFPDLNQNSSHGVRASGALTAFLVFLLALTKN